MDLSWNHVMVMQELVVISLLVMGDWCRLLLTALMNITQFSSRERRECDLYMTES